MDELRVVTPSPTSASSVFLSSPSSGSRKRYSEVLDSSMTDLHPAFEPPEIKPISLMNTPFRRSAHSLNHNLVTPTSIEPYGEPNGTAKLPSYLDRTQSCQNLFGVRMKLNRSVSGTSYGQAMESPLDPEPVGEFKRFPSIKIEPAPILPTRSTTDLNFTNGAKLSIKETSVDPDYDKITIDHSPVSMGPNHDRERERNSDYDHLHRNGMSTRPSENHSSVPNNVKPPTAPKPSLAKIKAQSQIGKGMRHLCSFLAVSDPRKIALLISIEDCKVFRLLNDKVAYN